MKLKAKDLVIDVREAKEDDIPLLLSFIRSMAEFEKLEVTATEDILRNSLFGNDPAARTLLVFVDGKPAAYVVYFFTFATMIGKRGLWVDDMFVVPEFREKGIAGTLMAYLAVLAIKKKCGRFEWMVLDWNKRAINFFRSLGANIQSDWRICRLDEDKLAGVAERLVKIDEGDCDA